MSVYYVRVTTLSLSLSLSTFILLQHVFTPVTLLVEDIRTVIARQLTNDFLVSVRATVHTHEHTWKNSPTFSLLKLLSNHTGGEQIRNRKVEVPRKGRSVGCLVLVASAIFTRRM